MTREEAIAYGNRVIKLGLNDETQAFCEMAIKALEQPKTGHWKEVYAESDGSNSWIEFTCPNCKDQFGIESGEYGWHYGDPIPWKACPICGAKMEE